MREILFRGKKILDSEWVYGSGINQFLDILNARTNRVDYERRSFVYEDIFSHEVFPETVGQYTGLKDKNGTKIFEGDIVKFDFYFDNPQLVKWNNEWCAFEPIFDARPIEAYPLLCETNIVEVIGNIYDNKNLLEEEL